MPCGASNVVKTALLRSVSHDLRSPLTAITAAAGGLTSETLTPEQRAELVSVIATESERLTRLVDNLLDLSRVQAGQLEPRADWSSAEELIEAATTSVAAPPGGFEVSIEPDLPMFEADAAQIERALANVLENAVRFAGDEPVTITAQRVGPRALDSGRRPRPGHPPRGAGADLRAVSHGRGAATGPGWGSRSRAGSSRPTAARCGRSRCPARGPRSRSGCR